MTSLADLYHKEDRKMDSETFEVIVWLIVMWGILRLLRNSKWL